MTLPPEDDRTVLFNGQSLPAGDPDPVLHPAPHPPADRAEPAATGASSASADTANALPVGTRLGEFEITGLLGEGGFGIVYLAHDSSLERYVALKEYMPSSFASRAANTHVSVKSARYADTFEAGLRSFVNEARMLAQFDHPSLIKVYRFWEANGTAYMVMPFYEGVTLKQTLLTRVDPPREAWLKALLAPLLDTLTLIHEQQCFHRDISPDNILMLEDGRPLLLDFGAARRAISGMEQSFTVIFKQGYAPIEQYADTPGMTQGPWTDLFALASVVHFAIAGKPPPPAVGRIVADAYVPLASRFADTYSAAFLEAIDQALSVKPEDRPQSAQAMRALLGLDDAFAAGARAVQAAPVASTTFKPRRAGGATTQQGSPAPAAGSLAAGAGPVAPGPRGARTYIAGAVAALVLAAGAGYALLSKGPPADSAASLRAAAPVSTGAASASVPAALPATAAAASTPAPFDPLQALAQIVDGAAPAHVVTATPAQARVRIGKDLLKFSVHAERAGYVYVLMVGSDRGNFALLFPNAVDKSNRIAAGQTMQLPRKGWLMGVDGPAGDDHFVVIVSDAPRDFSAAGLTAGELFGSFPIAAASQAQARHAGGGALFAGVPRCEGAAACPAAYGATRFMMTEMAP